MSRVGNLPVIRYFREAREELNKVSWPTQKEALTYAGFVIGLSVVLAAYFGFIDWLLTKGLEALVSLTA
jgi:preprotein translocase subunit SecE